MTGLKRLLRFAACFLWVVLTINIPAVVGQDEPALPSGLDSKEKTDEPDLPIGLGTEDEESAEEPALPLGLDDSKIAKAPADEGSRPHVWDSLNLTGFWEIRGGLRARPDDHQRDASIGETRLQLGIERELWKRTTFKLTTDLLYDQVLERHRVNLERGRGFLDLREASLSMSPCDFMDIKVGRQVLTWGTGDLLFLNDMFPKDWQSFFIGRDVEYLKAPSDAVKISLFGELVNWDIVFTPRFDPDRFITGERLSYYNSLLGRRAGMDAVQHAHIPNQWFRDHEWATRISRNIKGVELAAYGYWGYWKSPAGMDLLSMSATFPRLSVYGGSIRGPFGGGIANLEAAYYDSREDRNGNDSFIDNSQVRFLVGYERQLPEIATDLTVAAQYYLEWMMDYDNYRHTIIPLMPLKDELRHVVTFRVTKLLMNQNLKLSMFTYYSPSDADVYMRPNVQYKFDDHWTGELGGNVFFGTKEHTFFNQFARNSNVYVALRYSF